MWSQRAQQKDEKVAVSASATLGRLPCQGLSRTPVGTACTLWVGEALGHHF